MNNNDLTQLKAESEIETNDANRIEHYSLCMAEDIQDEYEYGKIYIVGSKRSFWLCAFHCPCGCGELLELLLIDDASPHWTATVTDDISVDLSPSIWKTYGCKSHFFIKNNRVIWVHKQKI